MISDVKVPLQLREAREALAIARAQGADHYAADTIQKGLTDLTNAEGFYISRHNEKELETDARQATQMAEDARLIAIREEAAEALAAERKASADAQAAAQAQAQQEADRARQEAARAQQAESDRMAAERARADAEKAKQEAQQAQLMAENARTQAQAEQQKGAAGSRRRACDGAGKAEQDKQALRTQLLDQLNKIMETRDSARGLIMNMSDVLFDFGEGDVAAGSAREAGQGLGDPAGLSDAACTDRRQHPITSAATRSIRRYPKNGRSGDARLSGWTGSGWEQADRGLVMARRSRSPRTIRLRGGRLTGASRWSFRAM